MQRYRINRQAVEVVARYLREPPSIELIERAELVDPQLRSIEAILTRFRQQVDAMFYVVGVAIVSYQLTAKGEEHWSLAAQFAEGDPNASLRRFASLSPSLRLAREARLSRIERFIRFYPSFKSNLNLYLSDLEAFRRDLAGALRSNPDAKTIVFAVKMLHYAAKAAGLRVELPKSIPVPVDRRVCLISLTSGIIEGGEATLEEARLLLSRASKLVAEAWNLVCRDSCIPPLKLDALLWLLGGCYEKARSREEALVCALRLLSPSPGPAFSLLRTLLGLRP